MQCFCAMVEMMFLLLQDVWENRDASATTEKESMKETREESVSVRQREELRYRLSTLVGSSVERDGDLHEGRILKRRVCVDAASQEQRSRYSLGMQPQPLTHNSIFDSQDTALSVPDFDPWSGCRRASKHMQRLAVWSQGEGGK